MGDASMQADIMAQSASVTRRAAGRAISFLFNRVPAAIESAVVWAWPAAAMLCEPGTTEGSAGSCAADVGPGQPKAAAALVLGASL